MERIKLTNDEKNVLRLLHSNGQMALDTMPRSCVRRALHRLKDLDLIEATWIEDYGYESVILTRNGRDYLIENPKLRNPSDWKWIISTAIGIATLAVAILALFIACSKL